MIGRLDRWLPVSGQVALFEAPVDDVATQLRAQFTEIGRPTSVQAVDGTFPDVLHELEPIDGSRLLLVAGGDWTAMFESGSAPDMWSAWSNTTERLGARAVLAEATPNVYGRAKGANTMLRYADPAVGDEWFGGIRQLEQSYTEDGWGFDAEGEPQPWEDLSAYAAKRPGDRLPPALVNAYLDAIGVPPLDGRAWGPGGQLVARLPRAPERRGLLGRRRAEPEPEPEPVAQTIAELHEMMYGDDDA